MSGQKGTSSGESQGGSLSFLPAFLAQQFFGFGIRAKKGLIQTTGRPNPSKATLDPQDLIKNLFDLADPSFNQGVGGAEELLGLAGDVGQRATQSLGGAFDTLDEGLETGFKADLDPIIQARQRDFFRNIVPGIQEMNVAANEGGAFGTDVTGQLFDAGKDLSVELGALETGLQTEAGRTRASLAGISGNLLSQLQGIPLLQGGGMLDLGEQLGFQGTAGGRQAMLLQMMSGINPAAPVTTSENKSKTGGGGI